MIDLLKIALYLLIGFGFSRLALALLPGCYDSRHWVTGKHEPDACNDRGLAEMFLTIAGITWPLAWIPVGTYLVGKLVYKVTAEIELRRIRAHFERQQERKQLEAEVKQLDQELGI